MYNFHLFGGGGDLFSYKVLGEYTKKARREKWKKIVVIIINFSDSLFSYILKKLLEAWKKDMGKRQLLRNFILHDCFFFFFGTKENKKQKNQKKKKREERKWKGQSLYYIRFSLSQSRRKSNVVCLIFLYFSYI